MPIQVFALIFFFISNKTDRVYVKNTLIEVVNTVK